MRFNVCEEDGLCFQQVFRTEATIFAPLSVITASTPLRMPHPSVPSVRDSDGLSAVCCSYTARCKTAGLHLSVLIHKMCWKSNMLQWFSTWWFHASVAETRLLTSWSLSPSLALARLLVISRACWDPSKKQRFHSTLGKMKCVCDIRDFIRFWGFPIYCQMNQMAKRLSAINQTSQANITKFKIVIYHLRSQI